MGLPQSHKSERRSALRIAESQILYPIAFQILLNGEEISTQLVNYHHHGACLKVDELDQEKLKSGLAKIQIELWLGRKMLTDNLSYRLAWESLEIDGQFGIEFQSAVAGLVKRPYRFLTHPHYAPTLTAKDPLNPNRILYLKVLETSEGGLLLQSSLTNKHLMQGMEIKECRLTFPGQAPIAMEVAIRSTRRGQEPGTFLIGGSIETEKKYYMQAAREYVAALSPMPEMEMRVEHIAHSEMLPKKSKQALSFRVIDSEQDYEKLLKLRYLGYKLHGKVERGVDWKQQGEGLGQEGMLIAGYMGGEMVSAMEMRFGDRELPFRLFKHFEKSSIDGVDWQRTVEISKLVVHPGAQGSDFFLGMIQKGHSLLVMHQLQVLMTATNKLAPAYEKIGFIKLGRSISHPTVPDESLHLMLLRSEVLLKAKRINAYSWKVVYRETHQNYASMGLAKSLKFNLWQRMQIRVFHSIEKVKNRRKRSFVVPRTLKVKKKGD